MGKRNSAENSVKTKGKPRGKPFEKGNTVGFKPGESGNPGGAPAGEKFSTIFYKYAAMPSEQVAPLMEVATTNPSAMEGVPYQHTMVLRTMAAYHNEPNASLLSQILDRTEGKVTDTHDHNVKGNVTLTIDKMIEKIYSDAGDSNSD